MAKTVIFDFDDTLVNTLSTKTQALQYTARYIYHFNLPSELVKQHWGKPYKQLMSLLFEKANDNIENIIRNYENIREKYHAAFYEGVLESLEILLARTHVGILTSAPRNLIVKDFNLLHFPYDKFFYIQTAEDTNLHKPDPEVFTPILKKLIEIGSSKADTIYIGDALNDYIAAKGAGLRFCAIADRTTSKEEFIKNNVHVLDSLDELLELID